MDAENGRVVTGQPPAGPLHMAVKMRLHDGPPREGRRRDRRRLRQGRHVFAWASSARGSGLVLLVHLIVTLLEWQPKPSAACRASGPWESVIKPTWSKIARRGSKLGACPCLHSRMPSAAAHLLIRGRPLVPRLDHSRSSFRQQRRSFPNVHTVPHCQSTATAFAGL